MSDEKERNQPKIYRMESSSFPILTEQLDLHCRTGREERFLAETFSTAESERNYI